MALKPIGTCITQVTAASAAGTGPISHKSDTLRCSAITTGCHVKVSFGSVANASANRVVGITTGSSTIIDFPEGTGSPFGVGDAVTLSAPGQTAYDFEHKLVTDVNTTAGYGGYFGTRITVDNDSSSGKPAVLTSQNAELRGSFKVSTFATGAGKLYMQQVQITGEG